MQFLSSYRGAGDAPLVEEEWNTETHSWSFFFFFNPNAYVVALDSHKMKTFYFGVLISEMACIWKKPKQVFRWMINKLLNIYIL